MKRIALLYGGKSPEHEISVRSARNIAAALDQQKFELQLIGVDRKGQWRLLDNIDEGKYVPEEGIELALVPGVAKGKIINLKNSKPIPQPDAIFIIIHGPNGEDGTVQGLLRCLDIPFVGPDVLGSAISMDKQVAKSLLAESNINVARGFTAHKTSQSELDYQSIVSQIGSPLFIKPANMGSSVGVHKVKSEEQFKSAIADAFQYDTKVLIEEMIDGREIECAVLGNENPMVSLAGEIIVVSAAEYSFDAKYTSATAAKVIVPADVSDEEMATLMQTALNAYKALNCEVMSRVDMFLTEEGKVYVNEINALPGFTNISMYPKLWENAGIAYTDLITELVNFSIARFERRKGLKMEW